MKKLLFMFLAIAFAGTTLIAQKVDKAETLKERDALNGFGEGWTIGTGFGLTLDQAAVWQPRAGAGDNSFKFGGLGNIQATYKAGRFIWDNAGSLQLNFQRLGRNTGNMPFQKSLDELRLNSRPGYAITTDEKWYAALDFGFQSQLLKTYVGNYLKEYDIPNPPTVDSMGVVTESSRKAGLLSQLFSPATITISPGVDWKPNTNFSVFFSPAAARIVTVLNDDIAQLGALDAEGNYIGALQGNPQRADSYDPVTGLVGDFDNVAFGIGALAKARYNNTFLEDRVAFSSELNLYYDYLNSAEADKNVPTVDWLTTTTFNIFKGIGVTLKTGAYYDYTKPVSSGWGERADGSYGYEGTKRGVMFTQTLALTYSRVFGAKSAE